MKKPTPKPIKAPKKKTKKKLASEARTAQRKALQEWSKSVRDRDSNQCAVCSRKEYIQAHHIIPKERFKVYMFEEMNGIALCPSCHKYGSFSFHRHPVWSVLWLKKNRPKQYKWVAERSVDVDLS